MLEKRKIPHTNLRVLTSDSSSTALNLALYGRNFSLRIDPILGKDERGRPRIGYPNGLTTTVDYEGAAGLYLVGEDIVNNKYGTNPIILEIPCKAGAMLLLERRLASNNKEQGELESVLSISKNGKTLSFKFCTMEYKVKEGEQMVTKVCETGLGVFIMTIGSYLSATGIQNHLNKLPENFDEPGAEEEETRTGTSFSGAYYGNPFK